MSSAWDHFSSYTAVEEPPDFLVSVEVYISNAAGASLKKPQTKSRKLDKRDSTADDLRLRERVSSNWLSSQKTLTSAGHWRSATCRLMEEGERCLLNVYVDETMLYQTVYIHLLNQTDIRPTEPSLYYRKDCIGIFCITNQRWTPSNIAEPLYLCFPNSEICATWQTLLKSYAVPEIYGRWFYPLDGGSYRMWRQVELTVVQGRNLGVSKSEAGKDDDGDSGDVDISCGVHLNDILCSRTTVKRGSSLAEWHESFSFPGLPPFENLDVVVWKEKKMSKPLLVGTARIALGNFRRGDQVDGWFPVTQPGALGTELQMGELRLKVKVDEEIILPYSSYTRLLEIYNSRNFLDWVSDLESSLRLKSISTHLVNVAIATNSVVQHVQTYAAREVENASTSSHTLFRGNTTFTKVLEVCMTHYGKVFLEASVGTILRRLYVEKVSIEVDPVRSGGGKSTKEAEKNQEQLLHWCRELWAHIYAARVDCPKMIFRTIRKLVEQRYRPEPTSINQNPNLPWQSVSAFIFLRFLVPAILHPHLFGLVPGLPPEPVQRSLTLIAKAIQSLANLNSNSRKQDTGGMQEFHNDSLPAMMDYIHVVSTPLAEASNTSFGSDERSRHDRINVVNALRTRTRRMTVLDRESIPVLPHLIDVPRHLAIVTSAVIRNSRELNPQPSNPQSTKTIPQHIEDFCAKCFFVEEEALQRVSQLAAGLASRGKRPSMQDISVEAPEDPPTSPRSTVTSTCVGTNGQSRRRKVSRPSTAPSPTVTDTPRRPGFFSENLQSPRAAVNRDLQPQRPWNNGHAKAPSTDSVPKIVRDSVSPARMPAPPELVEKVEDDTGKRKRGILRGILRR
ncbi:Rho GTPase activation protein [Crepidotus variabilis]|uniref:Rho GTPase activation protein n=1 Tax=Crepidotus variabilis TaxID=179855 RepID=A0A9P6ECL2_9AGAR|nr:Rho GTPase activation protein [Crepidotus variabilis]